MKRVLGIVTPVVCCATAAYAGTFTESNALYDLKVSYSFEGDRVRHEVELTNKLEIEVRISSIDATLVCASGERHIGTIPMPEHEMAAGATQRFDVEDTGCSPGRKRDASGKMVDFHDEIRRVDFSGRVSMAQHGTNAVALTWHCADEPILVTAIKFPRGTGFRLIASNGRSMTSTGEFDAQESARHLCGGPVEDAEGMTFGIRKMMGEVRSLCERAPTFCDKAYDVNNKRAAVATRG